MHSILSWNGKCNRNDPSDSWSWIVMISGLSNAQCFMIKKFFHGHRRGCCNHCHQKRASEEDRKLTGQGSGHYICDQKNSMDVDETSYWWTCAVVLQIIVSASWWIAWWRTHFNIAIQSGQRTVEVDKSNKIKCIFQVAEVLFHNFLFFKEIWTRLRRSPVSECFCKEQHESLGSSGLFLFLSVTPISGWLLVVFLVGQRA